MKQFTKFLIALTAMITFANGAWAQTKSITYLRYVGGDDFFAESTHNASPLPTDGSGLFGFYYVEGNVTVSNPLTLIGYTYIILCDGATLKFDPSCGSGFNLNGYNLIIYAQSSGSHAGKIVYDGAGSGIFGSGSVYIYGGNIDLKSSAASCIDCSYFYMLGGSVSAVSNYSDGAGIQAANEVVILGGKIYATGDNYGIYLNGTGNVGIYGGQVTANGNDNGISSDQYIHLGWTNATDFIESNSYSGSLSPVSGKVFQIDGGGMYGDGIAVDDSFIFGKKLTPSTDDASYTITLSTGTSSDNIEIDKDIAFKGERVAITVTPPAGKMLASLTYDNGSGPVAITKQANDYVFYMPAANVTVTATFVTPVAQIGSTKYATLAEALAAVTSSGTVITMIDDSDEGTLTGTVPGSHSVTIDLNGKTVSIKEIQVPGDFTIKDGTLVCNTISNTNTNLEKNLTFDNATVTVNEYLNWMANNIILRKAAKVTINTAMWLAGGSDDGDNGADFTIEDDKSTFTLVDCTVTGYNTVRIYAKMSPYMQPGHTFTVDGSTKNNLSFRKSWGIQLTSPFGSNATVTFYKSATKPTADAISTFTTPVTEANAGEWVVAHIVPADGYWTDMALLFGIDASGTLARKRAPLLDPFNTVTLLQADTYDSGSGVMKPRNDGAGWYYYQIPAEHTLAEGYYESRIDGDVVRKFDFGYDTWSSGDNVSISGNIITITHGTDDAWTANITLDQLSFPFTGVGAAPTITQIDIKRGSTTLLSLTDAADIATQLLQPSTSIYISNINQVRTNAASAYTWFKKYDDGVSSDFFVANGDDVLYYEITVPLTVADDSQPKGTPANPWLIKTPADLVMLADCVNVGQYSFNDEVLVQDNDIDMDGVVGFFPIGGSFTPFMGLFSAYGFEIQNLTISPDATPYTSGDFIDPNIGLFGRLNTINGVAAGVTLRNCTINACAVDNANVGGIAGVIDNKAGVVGCTLIGCTVTGGADNHNVGGIVGLTGEDCTVYENSIIDCTVGSKGLNIGGIVGVAAGTDDGACWVHVNRVSGTTEGSMKVIGGDNSIVGAIFGTGEFKYDLTDNKYDYNVQVKRGSTVASGYTKRGYYSGTAWDDITENEGAMILVRKATLPAANANGSVVTFNQVTKGVDRYDSAGDDYYYAVGQPISVTVTPGVSKPDDVRTFYDALTALTVNGTDISSTLQFTMPDADAVVSATFELSDWFTIDSNQKEWMSFYHTWEPTAAMNYAVTDGSGTGKTISASTVTGVNVLQGTVTTGDLSGTSFSGMPTLFHCSGGLPEKLKFTPAPSASTNVRPSSLFNGTTEDKDMSGYTNVYVMNASGDFYYADITSTDKTLKAHRCYVALGNTAVVAPARLHITGGGETAIDAPRMESTADDGRWFTIDGRRLESRPTRKGIYINGGRKVIIK